MRAERLPAALLERLGIGGVRSVAPVAGGWDTSIWRVESDQGTQALRVFGPGRAADCAIELLAMQTAARGGIPVPAVYAHETGEEQSAMLLSWIPGRPVLTEVMSRPADARALGTLLGDMQARIHAIPGAGDLRDVTGSWIDWVGPGEEELRSALQALDPYPDALLHLDYHVLNVMVDGMRVSGVLDWTNASVGDPRADLARTYSILALTRLPNQTDQASMEAWREALIAGWHEGYERRNGCAGDMALFYAWAGAVMARDLRPKLGRPGVWLGESDFDRIRAWTAMWKRQAGLSGIE